MLAVRSDRVSFISNREDAHMKSQECAHLNKTYIMITTVDMSVTGKLHKSPALEEDN